MRIGLSDLFAAPELVAAGGSVTYGPPFRMAKAIQADIAPTTAEAKLFADDGAVAIAKEFTEGLLTLGMDDLVPGVQAQILGQQQDSDGVVYANGDDDPPYFAVGFRARRADGKYRYVWLYRVKFSPPTENHATKGASIAFQTPQISGAFIKREDGHWKADYTAAPSDPIAAAWFTAVREPTV